MTPPDDVSERTEREGEKCPACKRARSEHSEDEWEECLDAYADEEAKWDAWADSYEGQASRRMR